MTGLVPVIQPNASAFGDVSELPEMFGVARNGAARMAGTSPAMTLRRGGSPLFDGTAPSMRHAEIGRDHLWVRLDLLRRPVGDLATVLQHHDAIGQIHHHADVVLD